MNTPFDHKICHDWPPHELVKQHMKAHRPGMNLPAQSTPRNSSMLHAARGSADAV